MNKIEQTIKLAGNGVSREVKSQVLQSPLSGISDRIFRNLVRKWAPNALLFTEMVNAKSLELGHGRKKVEKLYEENGPIGVQLFDYRPDAMVAAAKHAEAEGAFLIDINMGCPVKKIARKGGGSALIKQPELANKIVNKVAESVQIPVTVKTRLGWCSESSNPVHFARLLEQSGAQLLTLHGRTRQQGFSGKADWQAIAKVKEALKIPVIANGDIASPSEALCCLSQTKADGVMIGRGSLGAPWLVGEIDSYLKGEEIFKSPSIKEKIIMVLEQLQDLIELYGNNGLFIARKHIKWTIKGFSGASNLRLSLLKASTPTEAIKLLKEAIHLLS